MLLRLFIKVARWSSHFQIRADMPSCTTCMKNDVRQTFPSMVTDFRREQSHSIQKPQANKQLVLLSRNISWLSKLTPLYVLTESAPDTFCDHFHQCSFLLVDTVSSRTSKRNLANFTTILMKLGQKAGTLTKAKERKTSTEERGFALKEKRRWEHYLFPLHS